WLPARRLRLTPQSLDSSGPVAPIDLAVVGWPTGPTGSSLTAFAPVRSTVFSSSACLHSSPIIDQRGLAGPCETGALAHLGIARTLALQGDSAKVRAAYRDFLTLWQDANTDIPALIEAKSEYAKMKWTIESLEKHSLCRLTPGKSSYG